MSATAGPKVDAKMENNEKEKADAEEEEAAAAGQKVDASMENNERVKDDAEEEEEEEEALCRFCFEGPEEGKMLSGICACAGGQKYVHLDCLRRWQRMVLVSQPTHPAFYQDDVRHHKCNVCAAVWR